MKHLNALYYDGECPFCARYADYTKLRESIGIEMINAREAPEAIAAFRAQGVDIDEGMILLLEGKIYHGAEAIDALERALHPSWLGRALLRPWLLRLIYPLLKVLRRLALMIAGKSGRISG